MSTTSAASMATSVPLPTAMPTSATVSAYQDEIRTLSERGAFMIAGG